jgi:glutamate 5-kinase
MVIKVGTNVLTTEEGILDRKQIENLSADVSELVKANREVVLVSSGAITAGKASLGLKARPRTIPEEQAAAAIGQTRLMHLYSECFGRNGLCVGQVLLTQADLRDRRRYLNARNTILTLLRAGVVPIVNENDTVAVDEIYFGGRFGDNDTLSALVTNLIEAELLIILTDVDGLLSEEGLIEEVRKVSPAVESYAKKTKGGFGKGGMASKIKASKILSESGEKVVIANGGVPQVLRSVLHGDNVGTLFLPGKERIAGKKRWIAFTLQARGNLTVDDGAKKALKTGKSLLPSGIKEMSGKFRTGDAVSIGDEGGGEFARGLINYSSEEVEKIIGVKSGEIETILGYKSYDEVIHRDNLVILS